MARINLPPITRGLLAATVFFTLLNFVLRPNSDWVEKVEQPLVGVGNGVPYLTIVPGKSIIYPWVFALATVVEQNLAGLIINGATLFYGGRRSRRCGAFGRAAEQGRARNLGRHEDIDRLISRAEEADGSCLERRSFQQALEDPGETTWRYRHAGCHQARAGFRKYRKPVATE